MKKLFLIVILLCTNVVYSQDSVQQQNSVDCGLWLKSRKTNSAQYLETFLTGTVNGMALGAWIEIWRGTSGVLVSPEQLYFWMDQWCQKNPLTGTGEGVVAFANERTNGVFGNRLKSK